MNHLKIANEMSVEKAPHAGIVCAVGAFCVCTGAYGFLPGGRCDRYSDFQGLGHIAGHCGGQICGCVRSFQSEVPATARLLLVSSVGFEPKEIAIASGFMDISLEAVSGKHDELVVVGYGVRRVTKVSGAISSVKGCRHPASEAPAH